MMNENGLRPPAATIEALDAHLYHLQRSIESLVAATRNMATREDIEAIGHRLDDFATKSELRALESRVTAQSPASTFDRALSFVTRVASAGVAVTAFVGLFVALVHFFDKVPGK